eukprot:GHVU01067724.1.p1 GENE.GHVU01067724.1~~GHVU01067724.1.p1  ORF type:complete len:534 (-),score=150.75 GHVU01067724.1:291-1892(-)
MTSAIPHVLEQGGTQDRGEHARLQYFIGAIAIGDMIKTTLGPRGCDKILQPMSQHGEGSIRSMTITNDGATILSSIWLDNPSAKILVDVSKQQDAQCGDGTTGVVVLAAELLRNAEQLVQQKLHPQTICQGYEDALGAARQALVKRTFDAGGDAATFRDQLTKIAMTTLSSKLLTHDKQHFAKLAVDAVMRLGGKPNLDYIQVIKKAGGSVKDSFLAPGFILEKRIGVGQPKCIENCKVMVANTPMDTDKIKIYGARVKVDSFEAVRQLEEAEKLKMKKKVEDICKHGCNVFINRQLIYNYPEEIFKDNGVISIEHSDFDGMERLAAALGADIVSTFDNPAQVTLGTCAKIEEILIGEDRLIQFSGCTRNEACTIVLRGASIHVLDEAERSLHDALAVLFQTVQDARIVCGGGAAEMQMAEAVDALARTVPGKKSLAIEAFSKALREIPNIILENAGADSVEIVSALRSMHHNNNWEAGIDIKKLAPGNMTELGVFESYKSKLSQVCSAAEAAIMLIRVDDIIKCAPRQREGM